MIGCCSCLQSSASQGGSINENSLPPNCSIRFLSGCCLFLIQALKLDRSNLTPTHSAIDRICDSMVFLSSSEFVVRGMMPKRASKGLVGQNTESHAACWVKITQKATPEDYMDCMDCIPNNHTLHCCTHRTRNH